MKTQSELKAFKSTSKGIEYEYIYIYYKLKGQLLRVNTGNKVIDKGMKTDLQYNATVKGYAILNSRTTELKKRVDSYLAIKLDSPTPTISQKECNEYIKDSNYVRSTHFFTDNYNKSEKTQFIRLPEKNTTEQLTPELSFLDHYQHFYEFKQKELGNRVGFKDYKSLMNALIDYQKFSGFILTLQSVNSVDFLVDFRNFLIADRSEKKKFSDYKCKGNMNDNTINKRITALKTFYRYIESKEIYNFRNDVFQFKAAKYDNDVISLTKEDIKSLIGIKTNNNTYERIIDAFVMNCFLGLRYSDYSRLKPENFVKDSDNDYSLQMENKKTGTNVIVPINLTALALLKKYNYIVPVFSNQYTNITLKLILKEFNLFEDIITIKRKVNRQTINTNVKRNEVISFHTCRRTFITLSIEGNIPLNAIMKASGHTKLATMQKYITRANNKQQFKALDL
jgi:integrase